MALTVDQADINAVLTVFNIPSDEYFLQFNEKTVYLHWVASPQTVKTYLKNNHQCLDINSFSNADKFNHEDWIDAQSISDFSSLTPIDGFFGCRYIIAA